MGSRLTSCIVLALSFVCISCSGGGGEGSPASTAQEPGAASSQTARSTTVLPKSATADAMIDGSDMKLRSGAQIRLKVPRTFDLSHVEPIHFADALGKDPLKAFEFVRDQIAYEPYVGSLRGPQGTLMAMAGNAVDRAALLGALLQESGHRIRYVRGMLPQDLTRRLANSIWEERRESGQHGPDSSMPELEDVGNRLLAAIERDGAQVRASLRGLETNPRARSPVTLESLMQEARAHYWIEWWNDGSWIAMDPSFPDAVPGQIFAEATETYDVLPESLFHRVEIRIRLEEYIGDRPSGRELLKYAARAADLSGVDLLLVHTPTDADNNGTSQVQPVIIVRQERVDGQSFWLEPPRGNSAGGMADALGGGGDEVTVPLAAAEYIELDLIAPDGGKETETREIFDIVGKKRRAKGEPLSADDVLAASAAINPDEFISTTYDLLFTTGAIHVAHVQNLSPPSSTENLDRIDVGAALRRMSIAFSVVSDALTSRMAHPQGLVVRSYLTTPRVQIAQLVATENAVRLGLDLRRDVTRIATSGFQTEHNFNAQVMRGIVEGTLERLVVEHFGQFEDGKAWAVGPAVSTSWVFERARATGLPIVTLTQQTSKLDQALPGNTRARIEESLAQGNILVAPQRPILTEGRQRYAWWQIDAGSGATVAMTDEGLRGTTVELSVINVAGSYGAPITTVVVVYLPQSHHMVRNVLFSSPRAAELFCTALTTRLAGVAQVFWGWVQR